MGKFYGNLINRLEENKQYEKEIKIGTLLTEYHYSDRTPYEVVGMIDNKHLIVRELDHKKADDVPMSNNWELFSNKDKPLKHLVYRYNAWYWEYKFSINDKRYSKANISFGKAEYYYDYSF